MLSGWKEYKHCLLNDTAPHVPPPQRPSSFYLLRHGLLLARWTDNWDLKEKTEWWYCIKDDKLDMSKFNAKKRYETTKGTKNFRVKIFNPLHREKEIYNVLIAAYESYPVIYRPKVSYEQVEQSCKNDWQHKIFIGAFNETDVLCGFAVLDKKNEYIEFSILRVKPIFQKKGINAALVYFICEQYLNQSLSVKYINDGSRNIKHITNFQDYLIKYFGFRRAYCRLNIIYNPMVKVFLNMLYPFRSLLRKAHYDFLYNVYCILFQEQIRRTFL